MANQISQQPKLDIPFQSIRWVLEAHKADNPGKVAIFDLEQDKPITWAQLCDTANRVAGLLQDMGIGKGDQIGLLSDESVEKHGHIKHSIGTA